MRGLLRRSAYPQAVDEVELVRTAISYVFLAGDQVYKLRKPVNLGYLDFTTLEKRRADCEAEVRLNTRGCPGLYYGVEPVLKRDGRYFVGGEGEVVDYAVHMRRLPADGMMSRLLERDAVTLDLAGRLVARLVEMYAQAERNDRISEIGGYDTMVTNWREHFEQLAPFVGRMLSRRRFERIRDYAEACLHREEGLLRRRVAEGWVRDCHGDLRSDSICFDPAASGGICLFDCIEFNDRFRYMDIGLDLAFLAMDLDFRGRSDLSDLIIGLYAAAMGDKELPLLLAFFKCYRAVVRGKIESFLLDEEDVLGSEKAGARRRAKAYFRLAESYLSDPLSPWERARVRAPGNRAVLVMGLSGSGKSVLAGALASRLGAVLLSTDMLRRDMAAETSSAEIEAVDAGRYAPEIRLRIYKELAHQAGHYLDQGRPIVLDATFVERSQRALVLDALAQRDVWPLLIECHAPKPVIEERQRRRAGEAWTASEGRWDVYLAQKQRYEAPDELPPEQRIAVDTTRPLAEQIEAVLAHRQRIRSG